MKIFATLSMLLIAMASFAQNVSMTIFNNNGQQFFVVMNGIRQNSLPLTNVKIGGMTTGSYEVKLIFADGKTGDINKKIYFDQSGDYLARVVFKGKKRKLQYFGMSNEGNPGGGTNIDYRPNDQSVYSDQSSTMGGAQGTQTVGSGSGTSSGQGTVVSGQGTQTSGTTQGGGSMSTSGTVADPNAQNGQLGMGTNVVVTDPAMGGSGTQSGMVTSGTTVVDPNNPNGQFGMNVNININDPMMGGNGSGTGVSTSTTVSDPTNPNGQFGVNMNVSETGLGNGTSTSSSSSTSTTSSSTTVTQNGQVIEDSHNFNQTTTITENGQTTTTTQSSQSGNPGNGSAQISMGGNGMDAASGSGKGNGNVYNYSCTSVLTDTDGFVARLKAETFDTDKREIIEKELKQQCVSADQAYRIIKELGFDADRFDMCKYLYDRMTDRVNGNRLLELLSFDMDKEAFQKYMQEHK